MQEKLPYRSKCLKCKSRFLFQCAYCTNRYENEISALQHMFTERQCLSGQCPHCLDKFANRRALESHIKAAHPVPRTEDLYKCSNCNLVKKSSEALHEHSQKHCLRRSSQRKCKYCEFECNDDYTLTLHVDDVHEIRDGQSKFTCDKCGKMFKFLASYKRHEKLYSEANAEKKTFRCNCGYKTEWKCALHQHTISFGHPAIREVKTKNS